MCATEAQKWTGGFKKRYRAIPTAYISVETGDGVMGNTHITSKPHPALLNMIEALPSECERLYLVGPKPGDVKKSRGNAAKAMDTWLRQREVGESWEVDKLLDDDEEHPMLQLKHRETKRPLRVQRISQWLGEESYTPDIAQEAMTRLEKILQQLFDDYVRLLNTPGATGLDLWERSRTCEYPRLPDDLAARIRSGGGQGRFELFTLSERPQLDGLTYLDGRFMYAGLCSGLGQGPAEHREQSMSLNEFNPYRRGRYRIEFRVPEGWNHVGLFPVKAEEQEEGWVYPRQPGFVGETWADAVTIQLALSPPRGLPKWDIQIKEAVLFQPATQGHPWPLNTWSEKLIKARELVEQLHIHHQISPIVSELMLNALRNMLLHAIGGFHRTVRNETIILYSQAELRKVPGHIRWQTHADGTFSYKVRVPLSKTSQQFMYPEFSLSVWEKCRLHMLYSAQKKMGQIVPGTETGLLTLPLQEVVGVRVDALYLVHNPGWFDDGKPGRLRLKGELQEQCKQPETYEELNALRDRSVAAYRSSRKEE